MLKHSVRTIITTPKILSTSTRISLLKDGDYRIKNVPYQCQFATPELTADILEGRVDSRDDPNWQVFDYATAEEAAYWVSRQCGIACVKMILDFAGRYKTVAELTDEALKLNGYDKSIDSGWYYKPLAQLFNHYGLIATVEPHLSISMLCSRILRDQPVIASVNPEIIRGDPLPKNHQKSGHLVVVTGFQRDRGKISGFYLNNPSGKSEDMRDNAFISIDQFRRAYGEKGISVKI